MISIQHVSYRIADRTLLDRVTLTLPSKHRFGLIGRNGAGKTTLFRLLLGEITPETGEIEMPKEGQILSVAQETPGGEGTPLEFLLRSHEKRHTLMQQLETCEDPNAMGEIYEELMAIDAFSAEAKAAKILVGLGFDHAAQNRPLSSFSGGFRKRIALGAALFQEPDLLLLDEPTNYLDFESVLWLRNFLKTYPKTLVVISHDRDLLNHCAESIIHLHGKKLRCYKGNYDQFEKTFALQKMSIEAYNKKINAQRAHLQSFVDRFRAKASKAAQAQGRIKAIEKLSNIIMPEEDPTIRFTFPEPSRLPSPFLSFENINLGYPRPTGETHTVLRKLSGSLRMDDRIALLGQNGNGKSTYAKFLGGLLPPLDGDVQRLSKLNVGYFHQHQLEVLNPKHTALDHLQELSNSGNQTQLRTHLGGFGLSENKATSPVGTLSGGEKARLAFALICASHPHLLILDEPTNHLDMEMRQSLIMSVNAFKGAVIIISHDWHFLESTIDQFWIVADQKVTPFKGTLRDYQQSVLKGK